MTARFWCDMQDIVAKVVNDYGKFCMDSIRFDNNINGTLMKKKQHQQTLISTELKLHTTIGMKFDFQESDFRLKKKSGVY